MQKTRMITLVFSLIGLVACLLSLREPSSSPKGKLLTGTAFGFIGLSNVLYGLELLREGSDAEEA